MSVWVRVPPCVQNIIMMKRVIKSKIEYFSILNPTKVIRAWNKHKAAKKLKTEINNIREK